jgi:hypothetical protein
MVKQASEDDSSYSVKLKSGYTVQVSSTVKEITVSVNKIHQNGSSDKFKITHSCPDGKISNLYGKLGGTLVST